MSFHFHTSILSLHRFFIVCFGLFALFYVVKFCEILISLFASTEWREGDRLSLSHFGVATFRKILSANGSTRQWEMNFKKKWVDGAGVNLEMVTGLFCSISFPFWLFVAIWWLDLDLRDSNILIFPLEYCELLKRCLFLRVQFKSQRAIRHWAPCKRRRYLIYAFYVTSRSPLPAGSLQARIIINL